MYKTTRNMAGGTLMTCKDCGHSLSMNQICEKPIQSATDMLKHMAAHNASRAFTQVEPVIPPGRKASPLLEQARTLSFPASTDRCEPPITRPIPPPQSADSTGYTLDQLRLSEALVTMLGEPILATAR